MSAAVRASFREQARACAAMGSPFNARLFTLAAERLTKGTPVADMILGWKGDPEADALPLRLAGALHGLVLSGADPGLAAVYPPHPSSDDRLWQAVEAALAAHHGLLARLEGPPQTNEPQRSAALCPGMLTVASLTGLPLVTSELGASAGLNLWWDRFGYRFGEARWGDPTAGLELSPVWDGPRPPLPSVTVMGRAAVDRSPPDLTRPEDRLRLRSYVWPDQGARLARLDAAIAVAASGDIAVARGDAADWLPARLATPWPGRAHVVYHSLFWQYLSPSAQADLSSAIEAAGAAADRNTPLAWLRLEGGDATRGAEITLTLWPVGETRQLGRADHHGNWVRWSGWH